MLRRTSDKNRYIEAMTLNGKTYTKNYLKHADLQTEERSISV